MPKVLNYRNLPSIGFNQVLIDRSTPFGNPFIIGIHGNREEVIQKYKEWIKVFPQMQERIKRELKGKDLVCWCSPLPCHGDVVLEIANSD